MTTIPGGMYTGTPGDTETFGVGATFVSSSKTSPEVGRFYLPANSRYWYGFPFFWGCIAL
jgi:hypothetical protein